MWSAESSTICLSRSITPLGPVWSAFDWHSPEVELSGSVTWSFYKDVGAQSKRGRAKNVACSFCDAITGCSLTWVYTDIDVRNVLGQQKMNIKACVPIRRENDNLNAQFKIVWNFSTKKWRLLKLNAQFLKSKHTVLDLTFPAKVLNQNARLYH